MNPYSYIDYVNTFDLKNLNSTNVIFHKKNHNKKVSKTGHTGINSKEHDNLHKYYGSAAEESFTKIPNIGFPEMEDDYITNLPLKKYIQSEDLKDSVYSIAENGKEINTLKVSKNKLVSMFNKILKKFNTKPCDNEWNTSANSWFYINLFPSLGYQKQAYKSGNKYISPHAQFLQENNLLTITNTPFIRIFSNDREGCTVNQIGKTNHFKIGKSISSVQRYAVSNYTFGMSDLEYQRIIVDYLVGTRGVRTIAELNRELKKISKQ
jgi:hypothetical protein